MMYSTGLAGLADGPAGSPAGLAVALVVVDAGVHHDDAVAGVIGIDAVPAHKAQDAKHAADGAQRQQRGWPTICFLDRPFFFISTMSVLPLFPMVFQNNRRIVVLVGQLRSQDLPLQGVAAVLGGQLHGLADLLEG